MPAPPCRLPRAGGSSKSRGTCPIRFGDLTVTPGDLVLADSSGVVFVPAAHAEEVLAAAEDIAARERAMADAVRDHRPMAEVMGANYERLLERA